MPELEISLEQSQQIQELAGRDGQRVATGLDLVMADKLIFMLDGSPLVITNEPSGVIHPEGSIGPNGQVRTSIEAEYTNHHILRCHNDHLKILKDILDPKVSN